MIDVSNAYTTNRVEFKTFLNFHLSHYYPLQMSFFTLPPDEHLPILEMHHIPFLHTWWRIARIRNWKFTWSAILSLPSFRFILLFFSLFSNYVPFQTQNKITPSIFTYRGTRWRRWLTPCATNWKVVCLITDGIIILPAGSASNRNEY